MTKLVEKLNYHLKDTVIYQNIQHGLVLYNDNRGGQLHWKGQLEQI